jgi:hypothetical protein
VDSRQTTRLIMARRTHGGLGTGGLGTQLIAATCRDSRRWACTAPSVARSASSPGTRSVRARSVQPRGGTTNPFLARAVGRLGGGAPQLAVDMTWRLLSSRARKKASELVCVRRDE